MQCLFYSFACLALDYVAMDAQVHNVTEDPSAKEAKHMLANEESEYDVNTMQESAIQEDRAEMTGVDALADTSVVMYAQEIDNQDMYSDWRPPLHHHYVRDDQDGMWSYDKDGAWWTREWSTSEGWSDWIPSVEAGAPGPKRPRRYR